MNFWNLLLSCLFRCLFACLLAWFSCSKGNAGMTFGWKDGLGAASSALEWSTIRHGKLSAQNSWLRNLRTSESNLLNPVTYKSSMTTGVNSWLPNKFGVNASSRISSRFLCRWQQLDFQNRKLAIQIQKSDFSGLIAPSHCSSCR